MNNKIEYTITPLPLRHLYQLRLRILKPQAGGQKISLPNWIPGSYMIRDFAKNIVSLTAHSNGEQIAATKLDKSSWQFAHCEQELIIDYAVYAYDLSVRSAYLDHRHGFFNPSSVFFEVLADSEPSYHINIARPSAVGNAAAVNKNWQNWQLATTMPIAAGGAATNCDGLFGSFRAKNYAALLEHPVVIGDLTTLEFSAGGVLHKMAIIDNTSFDKQRLIDDLSRICQQHIKLFKEPPPVANYLFIVTVVAGGYGGLEHDYSSALVCDRDSLPTPNMPKPSKAYRDFLGLCSHEYFHLWNIKRLKPAQLIPYKLQQEQYTEQLWAFEGITSYYDDLALVRAGTISFGAYLDILATTISRVRRSSGRKLQSVADSSFDAWTKFYKQDENAANAIVSYYAKGALVALCIDALMRQLSKGKYSLDNVMQQLWQNYYLNPQGRQKGLANDSILKQVLSLLGSEHQQQVRDFFNLALYSTKDLPLVESLAVLGVELKFLPLASAEDFGGYSKQAIAARASCASIDARFASSAGAYPKIVHCYSHGAAETGGLSANDIIIAIDGIKADFATIYRRIASFEVGATISVHALRRDRLLQFEIVLQAAKNEAAVLYVPNENQREFKAWLAIQN